MKEKVEKAKQHFRENKKLYIGIGIGVGVTATAVVVFRGKVFVPPCDIVINNTQTAVGWKNTQTLINMIERSTPSKPVHLVGSNLYFDSLSEASRKTGHHLSQLSKHVNGHIPDLNGDVFELLQKV